MLTEQQVRSTFAKYFSDPGVILSPEPFHESCIWVHYTQQELENQLQILTTPPTFAAIEQFHNIEQQMLSRAISSGEYNSQFVLSSIPYEESIEFRAAELKKNNSTE